MTTLQQALADGAFNGLSDDEALKYGDETVVTGRSSVLWTYRGVVDQFGLAAGEGLLAAIKGAGLDGAASTYVYPGIDLSLDVSQAQLDAIAKAVPQLADVCAALKELGVTHGSRWSGWGVEQPTLEQITAARAAISGGSAWVDFENNVIGPLLTQGASLNALKSAAVSWGQS